MDRFRRRAIFENWFIQLLEVSNYNAEEEVNLKNVEQLKQQNTL